MDHRHTARWWLLLVLFLGVGCGAEAPTLPTPAKSEKKAEPTNGNIDSDDLSLPEHDAGDVTPDSGDAKSDDEMTESAPDAGPNDMTPAKDDNADKDPADSADDPPQNDPPALPSGKGSAKVALTANGQTGTVKARVGSVVALVWQAEGATSCTLAPLGLTDLSGETNVTAAKGTTQYVVTCDTADGKIQTSVSVMGIGKA